MTIPISLSSCQKKEVASDIIEEIPLSALEEYSNLLSQDSTISLTSRTFWLQQSWDILRDTVYIRAPYHEQVRPDYGMHSLRISGTLGEKMTLTKSDLQVFVDVWYEDSLSLYPVLEPLSAANSFSIPFDASGDYIIRYMPRLGDTINQGWLTIELSPQNIMPVAGADNADAWSRFGDPRDAGKRVHEGVDIFKRRGTPIIAASDGIVTNVSDRGLGGKQIWVRDARLPISHYYAHLDSQYVKERAIVNKGDTIGTVGNTGNARTTRPHLHYGMYLSNVGAIDPFPFIGKKRAVLRYRKYREELPEEIAFQLPWRLRQGPSSRYDVIKEGDPNEKLTVIGWTNGWWHVEDENDKGFVYDDEGQIVGL